MLLAGSKLELWTNRTCKQGMAQKGSILRLLLQWGCRQWNHKSCCGGCTSCSDSSCWNGLGGSCSTTISPLGWVVHFLEGRRVRLGGQWAVAVHSQFQQVQCQDWPYKHMGEGNNVSIAEKQHDLHVHLQISAASFSSSCSRSFSLSLPLYRSCQHMSCYWPCAKQNWPLHSASITSTGGLWVSCTCKTWILLWSWVDV